MCGIDRQGKKMEGKRWWRLELSKSKSVCSSWLAGDESEKRKDHHDEDSLYIYEGMLILTRCACTLQVRPLVGRWGVVGCANSENVDDNGQCHCGGIFLSISTQTSTTLCAFG
jgi:hypothetical protein